MADGSGPRACPPPAYFQRRRQQTLGRDSALAARPRRRPQAWGVSFALRAPLLLPPVFGRCGGGRVRWAAATPALSDPQFCFKSCKLLSGGGGWGEVGGGRSYRDGEEGGATRGRKIFCGGKMGGGTSRRSVSSVFNSSTFVFTFSLFLHS